MAKILHKGKYFIIKYDEKGNKYELEQLHTDGCVECFIELPNKAFKELLDACVKIKKGQNETKRKNN